MSPSSWLGVVVAALLIPTSTTGQTHTLQGVIVADGRPVDGAVVYVEAVSAETLGLGTADTAVVDQRELRFVPAVVVGQPGLTVEFLNSDPILHNVFSPGWSRESFDLGTYPSNTSRYHTFVHAGSHIILCHVHPEMVAYVVVVVTPHHAVTDPEGRFRIEGIPAGPHRVKVWRRGFEEVGRLVTIPAEANVGFSLELNDLEE